VSIGHPVTHAIGREEAGLSHDTSSDASCDSENVRPAGGEGNPERGPPEWISSPAGAPPARLRAYGDQRVSIQIRGESSESLWMQAKRPPNVKRNHEGLCSQLRQETLGLSIP